ncbi:MAG: SDR family NAD(P)-dependent oxidoreductase [Bacteroidetes bacterium]|nr:SDR family NAD(P)-dependent oxidoreductase [Bacteroidota bacterium]
MSQNKQHLIAYHPDNQQVATEIREELAKLGYIVDGKSLNAGTNTPLRQSITSPSGAVLLLVTDNFLKSEQCMNGAMEALQHWADNGQLVPIVADGVQKRQDGPGWETVPTSFERVSNIIQYMNHWQDQYLLLRKEKRGHEDDAQLEAKIEITKTVSGEIGEFLRYLRNLRWYSLADFKAGNYKAFRQFTDEVAIDDEPVADMPQQPEATQETTVVASIPDIENAPESPKSQDDEETPRQRTLAEIIQDSGDELMAENSDIGQKKNLPKSDELTVDLNDIPGMDLLNRLEQKEEHSNSNQKSKQDDEEGVEISSILKEVLGEEDGGEDYKFLGEDPDHPEDFDLDSLFDEEEPTTEKTSEVPVYEGDEVSLELVSDEEEGLVLRADGNGHSTPEEVLEHAVLLFDEGQKAQGLDFLRQTVQLNASDNTMRYYYAYALARYGKDFANAKGQLEVILANDMEHTDALFLLGELSENQGEFEEAKHNFETVAAIQPDFPEVYYKLGMLTLQHFEGQENLALEFFKKSVEFNPKNADSQYILATLYNEFADDQPAAIKHFNLALKYNPKHAFANYDLALLHYQYGDPSLAIEYYQKAVDLNPELKTAENDAAFLTALQTEEHAESVEDEEVVEKESIVEMNDASAQKPEPETPLDFSENVEEAISNISVATGIAEKQEEVISPDIEDTLENFVADDELNKTGGNEPVAEHIADAVEAAILPLSEHEAESPTLEDLLEAEPETEIVLPPPSTPVAVAKLPVEPGPKKFTATLEDILDQEDETEEDKFVLPLSNDKSKIAVKTVLITGATSGIGRATAELFAKNGYRVIATGRRAERLEDMSTHFKEKYHNDLLTLAFDVRNLDAVKSAIENLPEEWRNIDILINNAGLSRGLSPIHEGDIEQWETMIDTNIKGLLYLTRAIAPNMVKRRSGHIINVASSAGKEVYPGGNVYCATKFAVDALTKSMRLDLYTHNIRVSQVAPGHVEETEFASVRFDGNTERAAKVYENFQPLRASDVAEVIYFMATRPPHVNVQDVLLFGTQQAGSNFIDRSGRL